MTKHRVVVVGVDGARVQLLNEWAKSGDLPAFRRLYDSSAFATVKTPPGLFSGSVWPSFYTGVSPARHGRYASRQLKSGTYDVIRQHGYDYSLPNLWDVLSERGKRVAIIDAPKSIPSKGIRGVQVVDWATEDFSMELRSVPPELAAEIASRFGTNEIVEEDETDSGLPRLVSLRDDLLERVDRKLAMSEDILSREPWDFFFTLFTEVHTAGHVCWHLHDKRHPCHVTEHAASAGDVIKDVYVATDRAIGRLMDKVGDDAYFFVYDVNGIGPNYTGNHILDDVLLALDRQVLPPLRHALAGAVNRLEAFTPWRVQKLLYPIQQALRSALSLPVRDPAQRRYFQVPTNGIAGGIRINLEGREPEGKVSPNDYDGLCHELAARLSELTDLETGMPVVKRVIKTHEVYSGTHLDELPDLLVEWIERSMINGVRSPNTGVVTRSFAASRTGDHTADGVVFVRGPGIGPGSELKPISIYDMAPTLCGILGVRFPNSDGSDVAARLGLRTEARA